MSKEILDLITQSVLGVISGNDSIPEDKKAEAASVTSNAFLEGLKNNVSLDNISNITSLFSGEGDTSGGGILDSIKSYIGSALTDKLGLSSEVSTSIASTVLPIITKLFSGGDGGSGGGIDIGSLLGAFTGGEDSQASGGILGSIKKLFG